MEKPACGSLAIASDVIRRSLTALRLNKADGNEPETNHVRRPVEFCMRSTIWWRSATTKALGQLKGETRDPIAAQ